MSRLFLILLIAGAPGCVAQTLYPFLPCRSCMVNRYDSEKRLEGITQPVFIAQADKDRIMPFEHGQRLQAAHRRRYKGAGRNELYILRGLGHNDPLPPEFHRRLRDFLRREAQLGGLANGDNCDRIQ